MKKLDYSFVSNSVGAPFKSGSVALIQNSYKEIVAATIIGLIGASYDPTKVYILYGLHNAAVAPSYDISDGAVFYNGEIYLCYGNYVTIDPPNVMTFAPAFGFITGVNADPLMCTDGVPRNVHRDERMIVLPALSGANYANYDDARYVAAKLPGLLNPEMYLGLFTEFDANGIGITLNTRGYALCDGQGGRPDMRGLFIVGAKPGDTQFPAAGNTGGSKTHTNTLAEMVPHTHDYNPGDQPGKSDNANDRDVMVPGSTTKATGSTGGSGGVAQPYSILNPYYCVLYVVRLY